MAPQIKEIGEAKPGAGKVAAKPAPAPKVKHALTSEPVPIDAHCVGDRWTVEDEDRLAKLIAIIAMGQAAHAAKIVAELPPAAPALNDKALKAAAKRQLSITGDTQDKQDASRWRRDGFLFEAISWIAARQSAGPNAAMKDPHLKSTTQGLDGLMLELNAAKTEIKARLEAFLSFMDS